MLPFRSGRSWKRGAAASLILVAALGWPAGAAEPSASPSPSAKEKKGALGAGGVPLPIGHEIKGLVLPDYNLEGQLQARFEAAVAKRLDANLIQFSGLKATTYTPENALDLEIVIPTSTLDINTRVITSQARTTIRRADFIISGDSLRFDSNARQGTLTGNVRMVITDQSELMGKTDK